jgi:hypothetical protein
VIGCILFDKITLLVLLASFCVWTKSLVCKYVVLQGISLFRRISEDSVYKSENLRFPVNRPDDRAIPSGRPSVYWSILLDDMPYRSDASQTKNHPSGRRAFFVQTSTVSRSYCSSLYPFGRISSPSGRLSVIDQLQILSKFRIRED